MALAIRVSGIKILSPRFPPHSGPIPPQFDDVTREPLQRPSTPLASDSALVVSASTPLEPQKAMEHRGTLSFDDLFTYAPSTQPLKIQRRRRVDREHGHSLLTPPLTPSSSLRTATSIDSAYNVDTSLETSDDAPGAKVDHESTRFLLVGRSKIYLPCFVSFPSGR